MHTKRLVSLFPVLLLLANCCFPEFIVQGATRPGCENPFASDVVILADAAHSVTHLDFRRQLVFLQDVIDRLPVTPTGIRVAVVTYSDTPQLQFPLDRHPSKPDLIHAIGNITRSGVVVRSAVGGAIRYARLNVLGPRHASRPQANRIVVLVTDGPSTDPTAALAESARAKDEGIRIYGVGVGRDVDTVELRGIVSQPTEAHMVLVDSFSELSKMKELMAFNICKATNSVAQPAGTVSTESYRFDVGRASPSEQLATKRRHAGGGAKKRSHSATTSTDSDPISKEISFMEVNTPTSQLIKTFLTKSPLSKYPPPTGTRYSQASLIVTNLDRAGTDPPKVVSTLPVLVPRFSTQELSHKVRPSFTATQASATSASADMSISQQNSTGSLDWARIRVSAATFIAETAPAQTTNSPMLTSTPGKTGSERSGTYANSVNSSKTSGNSGTPEASPPISVMKHNQQTGISTNPIPQTFPPSTTTSSGSVSGRDSLRETTPSALNDDKETGHSAGLQTLEPGFMSNTSTDLYIQNNTDHNRGDAVDAPMIRIEKEPTEQGYWRLDKNGQLVRYKEVSPEVYEKETVPEYQSPRLRHPFVSPGYLTEAGRRRPVPGRSGYTASEGERIRHRYDMASQRNENDRQEQQSAQERIVENKMHKGYWRLDNNDRLVWVSYTTIAGTNLALQTTPPNDFDRTGQSRNRAVTEPSLTPNKVRLELLPPSVIRRTKGARGHRICPGCDRLGSLVNRGKTNRSASSFDNPLLVRPDGVGHQESKKSPSRVVNHERQRVDPIFEEEDRLRTDLNSTQHRNGTGGRKQANSVTSQRRTRTRVGSQQIGQNPVAGRIPERLKTKKQAKGCVVLRPLEAVFIVDPRARPAPAHSKQLWQLAYGVVRRLRMDDGRVRVRFFPEQQTVTNAFGPGSTGSHSQTRIRKVQQKPVSELIATASAMLTGNKMADVGGAGERARKVGIYLTDGPHGNVLDLVRAAITADVDMEFFVVGIGEKTAAVEYLGSAVDSKQKGKHFYRTNGPTGSKTFETLAKRLASALCS